VVGQAVHHSLDVGARDRCFLHDWIALNDIRRDGGMKAGHALHRSRREIRGHWREARKTASVPHARTQALARDLTLLWIEQCACVVDSLVHHVREQCVAWLTEYVAPVVAAVPQ